MQQTVEAGVELATATGTAALPIELIGVPSFSISTAKKFKKGWGWLLQLSDKLQESHVCH